MEAPDLERRLAAILAADVEGYSRLMHRDEEATMSTLSARRVVVDNLINEYRGRIANTAGDSVLAEFASVLDAVTCAVEIQNAIAQANESEPDRSMRFRIGINVGDVMVKDGDIFGDGVNVAARLEALADGGGICVSRGVRDHLRHRGGLVFDDLGEQAVKNIVHPVRAYRLRVGETERVMSEVPLPVETELSADNEVALELALWESVKDGGSAELASYLEHYPEGTFASLARMRQNTPGLPAAEPTTPTDPNVPIDALDLAFWDAIKDSQKQEELVAYLKSHPEGHFAALVRARILPLTEEHQNEMSAVEGSVGDVIELAFWESVHDTDNPRLLAAYLEKYPGGDFAAIALVRLEALRAGEGKRN